MAPLPNRRTAAQKQYRRPYDRSEVRTDASRASGSKSFADNFPTLARLASIPKSLRSFWTGRSRESDDSEVEVNTFAQTTLEDSSRNHRRANVSLANLPSFSATDLSVLSSRKDLSVNANRIIAAYRRALQEMPKRSASPADSRPAKMARHDDDAQLNRDSTLRRLFNDVTTETSEFVPVSSSRIRRVLGSSSSRQLGSYKLLRSDTSSASTKKQKEPEISKVEIELVTKPTVDVKSLSDARKQRWGYISVNFDNLSDDEPEISCAQEKSAQAAELATGNLLRRPSVDEIPSPPKTENSLFSFSTSEIRDNDKIVSASEKPPGFSFVSPAASAQPASAQTSIETKAKDRTLSSAKDSEVSVPAFSFPTKVDAPQESSKPQVVTKTVSELQPQTMPKISPPTEPSKGSEDKPVFTFGSTNLNRTQQNGAPAVTAEEKKDGQAFTFGTQSARAPDALPTFSFSVKQETSKAGPDKQNAANPEPVKNIGLFSPQNSNGKPDIASEILNNAKSNALPSFSFGANSNDKPKEQLAFKFGPLTDNSKPPSQPAFSFNAGSTARDPPKVTPLFTAPNGEAPKKQSPIFGNTAIQTENIGSTNSQTSGGLFSQTTDDKTTEPSFTFGQKTESKPSSTPMFTFGANSQQKPADTASALSTQFGAKQASGPLALPAPAPALPFGQLSSNSSTEKTAQNSATNLDSNRPSFSFGATNLSVPDTSKSENATFHNSTKKVSFADQPSSTPATFNPSVMNSSGSGNPAGTSTPSAFSFGAGSAALSQTPAFGSSAPASTPFQFGASSGVSTPSAFTGFGASSAIAAPSTGTHFNFGASSFGSSTNTLGAPTNPNMAAGGVFTSANPLTSGFAGSSTNSGRRIAQPRRRR